MAIYEKINNLSFPGCYEFMPRVFQDSRGAFIKTYLKKEFEERNINADFVEEYYTKSHQNVFRGLHFQLPPHDHEKIIYCVSGEVLDYIVDLRKGSPFYGKYEAIKLDDKKSNVIYLPRGIAHGFYVLSDSAIMCYKVSSEYNKENDTGILWSSVISLEGIDPIVSERDMSFAPIDEFISPFVYKG